MKQLLRLAFVFGMALLAGCRGMHSDAPPIHPNLNMDYQQRFDPMEPNPLFADDRAMRTPVAGTVPRGYRYDVVDVPVGYTGDNPAYLTGSAGGGFVPSIPVPMTKELLLRGRQRYDIYCAVCHGRAGDGLGIIMIGNSGQGYGFTPAPTFHDDRLRGVEDGYLFDVITNGVRTMPPYAQQIPIGDRWAIVGYLRALQRSQNAGAADVPPSVLPTIRATSAAPAAGTTPADSAAADTTAP